MKISLHHFYLLCNSDEYYVDDGCQTEGNTGDDLPGFFQSRNSTAGVRCCSEDGLTCDTPDGFNCKTDHVNFVDAVSLCETNGLRLCTKDELLSEICCGTGGSCNSYAVWTSTRYLGIENDNLLRSSYI